MYPGNGSEKPILRNVIDELKQRELKQRGNVTGRTIQVADKGLNCVNNILHPGILVLTSTASTRATASCRVTATSREIGRASCRERV